MRNRKSKFRGLRVERTEDAIPGQPHPGDNVILEIVREREGSREKILLARMRVRTLKRVSGFVIATGAAALSWTGHHIGLF